MQHNDSGTKRNVDREARDTAVGILDNILRTHRLTEDSTKGWLDSDDKTVVKTGNAVKRMAGTLKRGFARNISDNIPLFMLKQLQNMQALLMSNYKAKIHRLLFLRIMAVIGFAICLGAIILGTFLKQNHERLLREKLHGFPVFFSILILLLFANYLLQYIKKLQWPADKPAYWPFRSRKQYDAAMENFSDRVTRTDYQKNHRMAGVYKWLTAHNPDRPFSTERLNLLTILKGCPKNITLPKEKSEPFRGELLNLLYKTFRKHGGGPGSPFYDMLRRSEFFLTTEKPYGAIPPLYSTAQQLAYTFVSIIVSIGIICMVNIIRPDLLEPSAGKIILAAIVLMILITPVIITNYKSEKSAVKKVVKIPYWPFESQEDFDDAVKEHPQTAYLLDNHDL